LRINLQKSKLWYSNPLPNARWQMNHDRQIAAQFTIYLGLVDQSWSNLHSMQRTYCHWILWIKIPIIKWVSKCQRVEFSKFCPKSVAMAMSLEELEKEVRIEKIHANTFRMVRKIRENRQSRCWDTLGWFLKVKYIARSASLPSGLNTFWLIDDWYSTLHRIDAPKQIAKMARRRLHDPYLCTKFGGNMSTGACGQIRQIWSFIQSINQSIRQFLKWPKWCSHCKDHWLGNVSR